MQDDSETPQTPAEQTTRAPNGVDVNWLVLQIDWPFPTWLDKSLYDGMFRCADQQLLAERLVNMFNNLGAAVDRVMAADALEETVHFKYWSKLSPKATKMKPTKLAATIYMHPDYNKPWMLITKEASNDKGSE